MSTDSFPSDMFPKHIIICKNPTVVRQFVFFFTLFILNNGLNTVMMLKILANRQSFDFVARIMLCTNM